MEGGGGVEEGQGPGGGMLVDPDFSVYDMLSGPAVVAVPGEEVVEPAVVAAAADVVAPAVVADHAYGSYSDEKVDRAIDAGNFTWLEDYLKSYMPQYGEEDVAVVHAGLFVHIRRGYVISLLKSKEVNTDEVKHYVWSQIVPLKKSTSPFVNQGNVVAQVNYILNAVTEGGALGHEYPVSTMKLLVGDYMRVYLPTRINFHPHAHGLCWQFFFQSGKPPNAKARCMLCQRTFGDSSISSMAWTHFTGSKPCLNLTADVAARYALANPSDQRPVVIVSQPYVGNIISEDSKGKGGVSINTEEAAATETTNDGEETKGKEKKADEAASIFDSGVNKRMRSDTDSGTNKRMRISDAVTDINNNVENAKQVIINLKEIHCKQPQDEDDFNVALKFLESIKKSATMLPSALDEEDMEFDATLANLMTEFGGQSSNPNACQSDVAALRGEPTAGRNSEANLGGHEATTSQPSPSRASASSPAQQPN